MSVSMSVSMSLWLAMYASVCLSVCLSACLSVRLHLCPSVYTNKLPKLPRCARVCPRLCIPMTIPTILWIYTVSSSGNILTNRVVRNQVNKYLNMGMRIKAELKLRHMPQPRAMMTHQLKSLIMWRERCWPRCRWIWRSQKERCFGGNACCSSETGRMNGDMKVY